MTAYQQRGPLGIHPHLCHFIEQQVLPLAEIEPQRFWQGFADILKDLTPQNRALLAQRETLQQAIDQYHQANPNPDSADYKAFLQSIDYLAPEPVGVQINTQKVDDEIARLAGPQLVVPINNARYALNAANARWGSLYDALYGTDVLPETDGAEKGSQYNPVRGQKVVQQARQWLDKIAPLTTGSHQDVTHYAIEQEQLVVTLSGGGTDTLASAQQWVGYCGPKAQPSAILLRHHGIHAEIQMDEHHPIGQTDPAHVSDILMESALTTIMDCEDSVAAVDGEDKTLVYQNWLGLVMGDLSIEVQKGGQTLTRRLNPDRQYQTPQGASLSLPGRSLMLIRNVGHLMQSPAMTVDGEPVFEGLMDAVITSLIAKLDIQGKGQYGNSRSGSVYIVKPKMHGPEEVAFTNTLFARVEQLLALPANSLKMGIMDEERRTSLNLKACIEAARERVIFINTGFLDRTGDEIHTSMLAGAFAPKGELKQRPWIQAYEKANVQAGLEAGLSGKAQIGKGMWPMPDKMAQMMETKIGHLKAGANTAWVPSPTAATLHALHYHQVDVFAEQQSLPHHDNLRDTLLDIPLMQDPDNLTEEQVQQELDNNVQGILGYVVRWVHQGVGCSKVPDIHNVGLMEDRATLRISSQHIANWLHHGIVTETQVEQTLARMAKLVDEQNSGDPDYIAMTPAPDQAIAYQAAKELIFKGKAQPSGYTEPVLHKMRLRMKQQSN